MKQPFFFALTTAGTRVTLNQMQTLGLSSESRRSEGRLKSLFWPTVETAWDVDYLGQQGMWICTAVAIFTLVGSFLTGNIIAIFMGILVALFYLIGGMGIRQRNWPAAALIFVVYLFGLLAVGVTLYPLGILRIAVAAVLLANVRAAFIASEWRPAAEGEDQPTRFSETLADKFIDQMPARLWPKLQIPFIVLGMAMLFMNLFALGFLLDQRFGSHAIRITGNQ